MASSSGSKEDVSGRSSASAPAPAAPKAPEASKVQCGPEAVLLLNCLAKNGAGGCSEQIEAFVACAGKQGLKEFVLIEECPAPAAAKAPKAAKQAGPK
mmetsp:Transcript_28257/g.55119  ORF Transcript_28257/g.55119 Transcript_28257/m.55119 type:complete len:98 (-) Transcript_28257:187-480(-)